jgi:exo-beta-1,3-glucanase (GH17 family)
MSTIPYHKPGVTYNGLHATTNPTVDQVTADLATTKLHFDLVRTYYPQYGGGVVDVGKIAKDVELNLLLGLFLFQSHPDWTAGNYDQFLKPAVARGNIAGILVGNEDPQMMDNGIVPQSPQERDRSPREGTKRGDRSDKWGK